MHTSRRRVLLEVAVGSVADALAARDGGADRLELCSALTLGGLTPTTGLLAEVRAAISLPIIALARPRPGGFSYAYSELRVLSRDMDALLSAGVDGIAFGVLTPDGEIDSARCYEIVRHIGPKCSVFHRAFDLTPDPFVALDQLIDLGVTRVMTSGQANSAIDGAEQIAELVRYAGGRIQVLPAGRITQFNIRDLITRTGCVQVHAALRMQRPDPSTAGRPGLSLGSTVHQSEGHYEATDPDAVAAVRALC